MDRGLKERLVGAAVLVALGVWLIPWVLNGPEQSSRTESGAIELPAAGESAPLRSQTITLDNNRELPTQSASQSSPETTVPDTTPESESIAPAPTIAVESAAPSPPPESAASTGNEAGWYVQVGSYADEDNARRQADRVSSYGFDASVSSFVSAGRSVQRVRVGPQSSRELAETVASSLSAHGFVAQVVRQD